MPESGCLPTITAQLYVRVSRRELFGSALRDHSQEDGDLQDGVEIMCSRGHRCDRDGGAVRRRDGCAEVRVPYRPRWVRSRSML